ncbi:hypothetical protein [Lacibacter sediminis]|uniref:Uncharacterized protein n=1 Tax=Lacibacter sediminis TaxID=2760713 RepID=A0A7G5XD33_9BACT|nr:hypothetical protein [Lacibacter sediminis]QNA43386.1 hypothetical protein H4075_15025 [Lacibacter sediminis]
MKKLILSSTILLLLIACKKPTPAKAVSVLQTVEFKVFQAADYSAPVYNGVEAEVRLAVSKQLSNNSQMVLWDTLIPYQLLRAYPLMQTPLFISKKFEIVRDSEKLRFGKVIRYRDALNRISLNATGEDIPASVTNKLIQVDL